MININPKNRQNNARIIKVLLKDTEIKSKIIGGMIVTVIIVKITIVTIIVIIIYISLK